MNTFTNKELIDIINDNEIINKKSDREIQELEHDVLYDCCRDLSNNLNLYKVHTIIQNIRISRNLKLPELVRI